MMKKRFLVLSVLLAAAFAAFAQADPAALEKKLAAASGKEKLALLVELGIAYSQSDVEKSMARGEEALALAKEVRDAASEAKAHQVIGNGFMNQERSEDGLKHFQVAAALYRRLGNRFEVARSNLYIGNILSDLDRMNEAVAVLKEALSFFKEEKNQRGIATAAQNLGTVYGKLGDYTQALQFQLDALQQAEAMGDKTFQANALNSIGNIHDSLGDHAQSLEYSRRAHRLFREAGDEFGIASSLGNMGKSYWEMGKRTEALRHYRQSLEAARRIGNRYLESVAVNNLAVIYMQDKEFDKAITMFREAAATDRETKRLDSLATCLVNIGECHFLMGRPAEAESSYRQALAIAGEIKTAEMVQTVNLKLSSLFEKRGDYRRALEAFRDASQAREELIDGEKSKALVEMEKKFEAEKKQRQIEGLSRNVEIQKLQLSQARLRTGALIGGIALLLAIFLLLFRRYLHLLAFWKKKNYVSHYKLERQIGSGAMGVVWQATDLTGKKKSVALKLIREEHASDPVQRKRFLNEAYLVDRLDHPNIIRVFERGEYQQTLFIAMELLQGQTLSELIREGVRLPLGECRRIMGQLADALAGIHAQGILHRDVKPANVMLTNGSAPLTAKLLDFGLAQAPSLTRLTETGEILGTVYYMAPELICQRLASEASDVYALGVVYYEMLTLEKPFLGENPGEIIRAILEKEPLSPIYFRPDLAPAEAALVLRMLSKDPGGRPAENDLLAAFAAG
ncbi:MAG: tetratricopeptide repeat protein [Candidatus Aminicenantes bacterium]|nr:tetratricopeptide repeat protein [Candidatus Aminicenantes bacterium]